jgi:hypothetical protein
MKVSFKSSSGGYTSEVFFVYRLSFKKIEKFQTKKLYQYWLNKSINSSFNNQQTTLQIKTLTINNRLNSMKKNHKTSFSIN